MEEPAPKPDTNHFTPAPCPTAPESIPTLLPADGPFILDVLPLPPEPPLVGPGFWLGVILVAAVFVGLIAGGERTRAIALSGLETLPFVMLALLAYAGARREWARVLTLCYWPLLMGLFGLLMLLSTAEAVAGPDLFKESATRAQKLAAVPWRSVASTASGITIGLLLGAFCFLPALRQTAARVLPLNPASFVHATALATVVAVTVTGFVPLLMIGEPPLLLRLQHAAEHEDAPTRTEGLSDNLSELAWRVPAAFILVGFPIARRLRPTVRRLGLTLPSHGQLLFALGAGVTLIPAMRIADLLITAIWSVGHFPTTKLDEFEKLMSYAINPWGALVIAVTAGLGEELIVRGVLQPRMGLILSNLFFTSLHAMQYNFDALLSIFLIGFILGHIRRRTNTTTSAIVHGVYDGLAILLSFQERFLTGS
jgi:membrane protease YdiL (CAAX protease family)